MFWLCDACPELKAIKSKKKLLFLTSIPKMWVVLHPPSKWSLAIPTSASTLNKLNQKQDLIQGGKIEKKGE